MRVRRFARQTGRVAARALEPSALLAILAATPARLRCSTGPVGSQPSPPAWTAVDVLAHLRACADVWEGAIATILAGHENSLRAVNPLAWITRTDYRDRSYRTNCAAFRAQRTSLLALLGSLEADHWDLSITVTGAGAPLRRTVRDYVTRLARHERSHWSQIGRLVGEARGSQRAAAGGPTSASRPVRSS